MLHVTETLLGKTPFLHAQEERIHCQTLLWCRYSNGWPRSTAGRWSLRSQRRAGFGYPLTDDGFAALAAGRCNKLVSLDVSGCAVNDAKLLSIAAGFPELRELTLLQCLSVKQGGGSSSGSGQQERHKSEYPAEYGQRGFVNPFDDIHEYTTAKWIDTLTDTGIIALASSCHQLKSIVFDSAAVTDASIAALAANCVHLTELKINCVKVTDRALAALAKQLPELQIDNAYEGEGQ